MGGGLLRVRETTAVEITAEPGNGTRYRLILSADPCGGLHVTWYDARWFGAFDTYSHYLTTKAGKLGKVDLEAIRQILIHQCPASLNKA